jgi:hypothetical protein
MVATRGGRHQSAKLQPLPLYPLTAVDGIGKPVRECLVIRYWVCNLKADNRTEDIGFAVID